MLVNAFKIKRQIGAIVLPLAIMCLLILLRFTNFFIIHNYRLSIGITADLVFSIPLIHLFLSERSNYLKYSTAAFFTLGVLIANLIIPKNDQFLLSKIKIWIIPFIELCSIIFFVVKTRKILARSHKDEKTKGDFHTVFKSVARELMPNRLASILSAEISAFYYAFFSWQKPVINSKNFTYHKETGIIGFIGVFIFMILIETFVFHLVLTKWNTKIAWVISGISIYGAVQAFGIAKSIVKRPIQIIGYQLIIPYGILAETTINLEDILSINNYDKGVVTNGSLKCLSPFKKIEDPNVVIELSKPYYIDGIYGSKKSFNQLLINVDRKESFIEKLRSLLN